MMGSVEIVNVENQTRIIARYRGPVYQADQVLGVVVTEAGLLESIAAAISELPNWISPPDFINIPIDVVEEQREAVWDGLRRMAEAFGRSGIDLTQRGLAIQRQPDPWSRYANTDADVDEMPDELANLSPAEIYLSSAMQIAIVDLNIGLFQAWWEWALAFAEHPDNPEDADQLALRFWEHTRARLMSGNS
jgi:hypothetical protein